MKKNRKGRSAPIGPVWIKRYMSFIVVLLNIAVVLSVFFLYSFYSDTYEKKLKDENLGNIANMNRSAAVSAIALFESWNIKLEDIKQYSEMHGLTYGEALNMISETNSSDDRYFELIGGDYKGHLARKDEDGNFSELDYSNGSYLPLQKIFDGGGEDSPGQISFAPEYTDGGDTAAKFVAVYKHIWLKDATGEKKQYTLLLATKSKELLEILNAQDDYQGQSTVLIDESGDYIVSNRDFKSSNFYQYLYVYNKLTLDEKNAIKQNMGESGELYYKNGNSVVEECVFRYEKMASNGWYCVTCVPLHSFHETVFNVDYIIYVSILFFALLIMDIAWMQGMNRRLRASMLREKKANEAKDNFLSRMSHEIRTPLNAVIGYNTIARNELTNTGGTGSKKAEIKVEDCLRKSEIASKHLLAIINDVLDMAAIESGKVKVSHDRFDFKKLISSITTIFYSQAKAKNIDFEVIFDTLIEEYFVGDQMRTNQILTNLLSNAVKFTPEGGAVKLRIRRGEDTDGKIGVCFEVIDTGIGMTPEYLSHIWIPFEQADSSIARRFGGTGLGLSITKNFVDLLGGTIGVESALGVGTKFTVALAFEKAEQPQSAAVYDFGTVNALVADDEEAICEYVTALFKRCGARCTAVTSGEAALKTIADSMKQGDKYSVCIIDWKMPEMDGIETVRRIRGIAGRDMPIIVLTAYDYTEIADKAAEIGVSKFISKPLFQSSLFDLLADISGVRLDKPTEKSKSFNFDGRRVLLAEDNAMNMEIAKTIMESAGLIVDNAWNGKEAVNMFTTSAPGTYMAILMDVHMPEMSGHDAARTIRISDHPEAKTIPIVAMTADAFAENIAEAYDSGMNAHIAKPIDVVTLFETLNRFSK